MRHQPLPPPDRSDMGLSLNGGTSKSRAFRTTPDKCTNSSTDAFRFAFHGGICGSQLSLRIDLVVGFGLASMFPNLQPSDKSLSQADLEDSPSKACIP